VRQSRENIFFSRFDPAREKVIERLPVSAMTFDGARFWYAEQDKKGFGSTSRSNFT
jgi:hypothetical protein